MKQLLKAFAVSCVLASSVAAGEIPTVGVNSPTTEQPQPTITSPGDIPSVGLHDSGTMTDAFVGMLQTVWSLM